MASADIGAQEIDFTDNAFSDLGASITYTPYTKTTDPVTGAETLAAGTPVTKTIVFVKRVQRYVQTKEGLVDLGDAYGLADRDEAIAKDARITYNGEVFLVSDVIMRYVSELAMFQSFNLFKITD
jgi:hypothetical protein